MHIHTAFAAAAVFCLLPLHALPQGAQQLGLAEVLAQVERHNPELAGARQLGVISRAERLTAQAYPNPELELSSGPWRSRIGAAPGTASGVTFSQPIELPSVREARTRVADAGIESAESQARLARIAIGYQARQAFFELLRRQEEERLAGESARLLAEIQQRVQRRVEVGEAARFELVRAESEALTAQNGAASARLRTEEVRALLRRLSGNTLPLQFEARGQLPPAQAIPPLSALQPEVFAAHPSLRMLAAERERAQARLEQERALRYPQPTLRAGGARDPETRQTQFGISIPLPLWNRREGQIAQALGQVDLAAAQLESGRAQLARELDSAYARLGISSRQIQTFQAGLLRSAEAGLQAAEAAWRFGERSFLEVLDAQRTLRSVRSDYNDARHDRHAAWLDIERLLARDPFRTEQP